MADPARFLHDPEPAPRHVPLVDAHVHLFDSGSLYTSPDDYDLTRLVSHEEERRRIESGIDRTLERFLCSGVTTVASLGGPRFEVALQKRAEPPRVVSAGPFLASFPVGATLIGLPLAAAMFATGWGFQLAGHCFEGKKPSFVDDKRSLIIGVLWCLEKYGLRVVEETPAP